MNEMMVVAGTRPEIIKMAPILGEFQNNSVPFVFVHCGQHYDYNMSQQFIKEIRLPKADYSFKIKAYSPYLQIGRIIRLMGRVIEKVKPKLVLVEGDTNGVLASALAAAKLDVPIGHVEAGLRSFDLRMPEEHNRRLVDHVSTYLFAPTDTARKNLERESVWGRIYITGNTIVDAVMQHLPIAERNSTILEKIRFEKFALVTAHRAENVDNQVVLRNFVESFVEATLPIVYPIHPRTRKYLRQYKMWNSFESSENVQILPPLGYFDFLLLMKECEMIITDSGGVQEEATIPPLRKPVLVIRVSTERPEAVEAGFAKVVGVNKKSILDAIEETLDGKFDFPEFSPYGDGNAGRSVVRILMKEMV